MWNTTGQDGSDTYRYFLNICNNDENDGMLCPDLEHSTNVTACQRKDSDANFGKSMGMMGKQKLRYDPTVFVLSKEVLEINKYA